jgi:hypothetical protein
MVAVIKNNNRCELVTDSTDIKLVLNWYEIKGNNLIGDEAIQNMSVHEILSLFQTPLWNNLYQCWAVCHAHIDTLQNNVLHKINTKKYSYFVEIYRIS